MPLFNDNMPEWVSEWQGIPRESGHSRKEERAIEKKMDREKSGTGEMKCPIEAFDCEKNMKRVNCELCHFHVPCVHLESHLPVSSVFLAMFLKHQHQLPRYMRWTTSKLDKPQ